MATIENGNNGLGGAFAKWCIGIGAFLVGVGIAGIVTLTITNSITLGAIAGQLTRMEQNQLARDNEQNRWIDYFRQRIDDGRRAPPQRRGRQGHDDGD